MQNQAKLQAQEAEMVLGVAIMDLRLKSGLTIPGSWNADFFGSVDQP